MIHAQSYEEALAFLDGETFDAILLDLFLTDSPGLETLWRQGASLERLPIIRSHILRRRSSFGILLV